MAELFRNFNHFPVGGDMRLLKVAALFALATLPLLLMRKGKEVSVPVVDSDHIFDQELSGE